MKIKKLTNLQKQSDIIDDPEKLSLGSLYFIGASDEFYNGSEIAAMPVSIKQNTVSLYLIIAYRYHILKSSDSGVVIFPFKVYKPLARIVRIFNIKVDNEIVDRLFNYFAGNNSCIGNMVTARVNKRNVYFTENITTFKKDAICKLNLRLIRRIKDISKWPALAIKEWAMLHLKLKDDYIEHIYRNILHNKKSLISALQKHYTYSAGENITKNNNQIKLKTTTITEIDGSTMTVDIPEENLYVNIPEENRYENHSAPLRDEEDDIPF